MASSSSSATSVPWGVNPGQNPRSYSLFSSSLSHLGRLSDEDLQGILCYLSSRMRAAGSQYVHDADAMSLEQRTEFLKYLFSEGAWFTMLAGFIRCRLGSLLVMPDCLNELGRLMLRDRSALDHNLIAAACQDGSNKSDKVLRHYYSNWWNPFDICANWDGTVGTVVSTYTLQKSALHPIPDPPIITNRLSDMADKEIAWCVHSITQAKQVVVTDTEKTLKEITHTAMLIGRFEGLLKATQAEENAQRRRLKISALTSAGMSAEDAEKVVDKGSGSGLDDDSLL
ncbi:hypothetical protein BKA70DRAFT_1103923 [Coprinopsis sp. MPI-PUGE-AT-0042]|nr:hypothetical protein BKA70DRAFT_1103923 [Coprinopsis sp. MPI-PUGE-AT-0042]